MLSKFNVFFLLKLNLWHIFIKYDFKGFFGVWFPDVALEKEVEGDLLLGDMGEVFTKKGFHFSD